MFGNFFRIVMLFVLLRLSDLHRHKIDKDTQRISHTIHSEVLLRLSGLHRHKIDKDTQRISHTIHSEVNYSRIIAFDQIKRLSPLLPKIHADHENYFYDRRKNAAHSLTNNFYVRRDSCVWNKKGNQHTCS